MEQFLPLNTEFNKPTDLVSAINVISNLVKNTNDSDLLIKMGEINGKITAYNLTKSNVVLESIIVDIAIIMQTYAKHNANYNVNDLFTLGRPKVIYYNSTSDQTIYLKELLDNYYVYLTETLGKSQTVARSYKSYAKKVFVELEKEEFTKEECLAALQKYLRLPAIGTEEEIKNIRNRKSAAKLLLELFASK